MSTINFAAREINCKIVYYGPGMSGKTTNLRHVFTKVPTHLRGEMISLATDLGSVQGFKTRFHLYTVPGQVFYNASRKLILRGVDGIVFVADSAPNRLRANAESMRNLRENLLEHGLDIKTIPMILQINKRDLEGALPVEMIRAVIDPKQELLITEASAHEGKGVFETLKAVSKMVLERLSQPT